MHIEHVLDRLGDAVQRHAPDVWETLRPGAGETELAVLRKAVRPHKLTGDVTALFRWADGQERGGPWWPGMECGPLLSTAAAAEQYAFMTERLAEPWQWSALWVPIAHEGWHTAGVEIAPDGPGVVIDGSFPEPPRVIAPTLATLLDVTADMVEAGIGSSATYANAIAWRQTRAELMDARPEWRAIGKSRLAGSLADAVRQTASWPRERTLGTDVGNWPPDWRPRFTRRSGARKPG